MAQQLKNIDDMFERLCKDDTSTHLVKKYLTKELVEDLREKRTSNDVTLADCIYSGTLGFSHLNVGMLAGDPESYTQFAPLIDLVVKDFHKLNATEDIAHPATDFGDLVNLDFGDLDPEGEMIISTRIRVGRSHQGFPFPTVLTTADRLTMEKKCVDAFECLDGELKGTYHRLTDMSKDVEEQLIADHFLFNRSHGFLEAAGCYNDWPEGRGIFFSENKNFLVWVNEEDHLRIISMQKGGDLGVVYKRLVKGIKSLERKLTFVRDNRLGYLVFCPSNIGTTIRASVHIKIPHLAARKDFKTLCESYKLQARGIHGEHTQSEGGVYDISNKCRLGRSEIDVVNGMAAGVKEFIRLEKEATSKEIQVLA